jgi:hypothetical protein
LTGCGTQQIPSNQNKTTIPKWLDNPNYEAKGKITAVGCAYRHINGQEAQRKLALQRAIDTIAMQVSTKVSIITLRDKTNISSSTTQSSLQEVNNQYIKTKILNTYITSKGKLCILIVKE